MTGALDDTFDDILPCRSDPDQWFTDEHFPGKISPRALAARDAAVDACLDCPLMIQCRDYARTHQIIEGVWGAETQQERKAYLLERGINPLAARRVYLDTFVPTGRKSRREVELERAAAAAAPQTAVAFLADRDAVKVEPGAPIARQQRRKRSTSRSRAGYRRGSSSEGRPDRDGTLSAGTAPSRRIESAVVQLAAGQ